MAIDTSGAAGCYRLGLQRTMYSGSVSEGMETERACNDSLNHQEDRFEPSDNSPGPGADAIQQMQLAAQRNSQRLQAAAQSNAASVTSYLQGTPSPSPAQANSAAVSNYLQGTPSQSPAQRNAAAVLDLLH